MKTTLKFGSSLQKRRSFVFAALDLNADSFSIKVTEATPQDS